MPRHPERPAGEDPRIPLLDERIERYLAGFVPPPDAVRRDMEAEGARRGFPLVGPVVGSALELLARSLGARRVFEMGSGFGYSAWWFARAVGPEGRIVLTDGSEDNCRAARAYLERSGVSDRVHVERGDALEIARAALEGRLEGVSGAEGGFDVVFCDIDKHGYPDALPLARRLLREGGLFIVDNMLWSGRVVVDDPVEPSTRGAVELARRLRESDDFLTVLLPLRDGVTVSLKRSAPRP